MPLLRHRRLLSLLPADSLRIIIPRLAIKDIRLQHRLRLPSLRARIIASLYLRRYRQRKANKRSRRLQVLCTANSKVACMRSLVPLNLNSSLRNPTSRQLNSRQRGQPNDSEGAVLGLGRQLDPPPDLHQPQDLPTVAVVAIERVGRHPLHRHLDLVHLDIGTAMALRLRTGISPPSTPVSIHLHHRHLGSMRKGDKDKVLDMPL